MIQLSELLPVNFCGNLLAWIADNTCLAVSKWVYMDMFIGFQIGLGDQAENTSYKHLKVPQLHQNSNWF